MVKITKGNPDPIKMTSKDASSNEIVKSNWKTTSFLGRQQVRVKVIDPNTIEVQVIHQNALERLGNFLGLKNMGEIRDWTISNNENTEGVDEQIEVKDQEEGTNPPKMERKDISKTVLNVFKALKNESAIPQEDAVDLEDSSPSSSSEQVKEQQELLDILTNAQSTLGFWEKESHWWGKEIKGFENLDSISYGEVKLSSDSEFMGTLKDGKPDKFMGTLKDGKPDNGFYFWEKRGVFEFTDMKLMSFMTTKNEYYIPDYNIEIPEAHVFSASEKPPGVTSYKTPSLAVVGKYPSHFVKWENGDDYQGELTSDGKLTGEGTLETEREGHKQTFKGTFADGLLNGQGEINITNKDTGKKVLKEEGTFTENKLHGSGSRATPSFREEGNFDKGVLTKGTRRSSSNDLYEKGIMSILEDGIFENGKLIKGTKTFSHGPFLEGYATGVFVDDQFTGKGKLYLDEVFREGTFLNGKLHGEGTLETDDFIQKGEFDNGAFVQGRMENKTDKRSTPSSG